MQWRSAASAWGAARRSSYPIGLIVAAAMALGAGGCSSLPSGAHMSLASGALSGSTVAFESIDGPPPEVFEKLVASLNDEAGTRQIAVVSRTGSASYRVRGYVSALVERDKTTFAWVWDVYDADKRRAVRISGEEPAAAVKRRGTRSAAGAHSAAGAWASADDALLRRMARNGMEQMASFLNSGAAPAAPPPAPAAEPTLVSLVTGRDDSPEAAGIFRLFGGETQAAASPPTPAESDVPLPSQQPRGRKTRSAQAGPATDGRSPR
jgi:hypothetical protein